MNGREGRRRKKGEDGEKKEGREAKEIIKNSNLKCTHCGFLVPAPLGSQLILGQDFSLQSFLEFSVTCQVKLILVLTLVHPAICLEHQSSGDDLLGQCACEYLDVGEEKQARCTLR
jgi:hypothetical protein